MGDWYTIGIAVGLGVAFGILAAGVVPRRVIAALLAAVAGSAAGFLVGNWPEEVGGLVGGLAGALGAAPVMSGALRRGGTRSGLAAFSVLGAAVAAGLAFVPVVGYLQAVALPLLARRVRARDADRHAGLRTLARD